MTKYHFLPEEGSPEQITFSLSGGYRSLEQYAGGEKEMSITDGKGSLVLIHKGFQSSHEGFNLDKIHTYPEGSRMKFLSPHAEDSRHKNETGPRLDLWWLDREFAKLWVEELKRWEDPDYRKHLLKTLYGKGKEQHFNVPYRERQLRISNDGLKRRIEEAERCLVNERHIHLIVDEAKRRIGYFFNLAIHAAESYVHEGRDNKSKTIIKPECFPIINDVNSSLGNALELINSRIDPEMEEMITNYWDKMASWENL